LPIVLVDTNDRSDETDGATTMDVFIVYKAIVLPLPIFLIVFAAMLLVVIVLGPIVLVRHIAERKKVRAEFQDTATKLKPRLPLKIDGGITITDVSAHELMLTYTLKIDTSEVPADPYTPHDPIRSIKKRTIDKLLNKKAAMYDVSKLGATYRLRYFDQVGTSLGTFDLRPWEFD
jgi:hypothetical protein